MTIIKLQEDNDTKVVCDFCYKDYTFESDSGGFIFSSCAYCPACAPKALAQIKRFKEEHFIKAFCPPGISFWSFVVNYRNSRRKAGPDL